MENGTKIRLLSGGEGGGAVDVPPGVSHLTTIESKEGRPQPALAASAALGGDATLEVLRGGSRPLVLLLRAAATPVRVNGLPAPRLAALGLRDEVRFGDLPSLHLTVWREPQVGPAPAERRDELCPVCHSEIGPGVAFSCPCGHLLHMNGEEVAEDLRLQCTKSVPRCPSCEEEIRTAAGYLYEIED